MESKLTLNPLFNFFGLYTIEDHNPIPLKSITANIEITDFIAKVTYSQLYFNQSESRLETEYFFPVSPSACFHRFAAKFLDTEIEGVIMEKTNAEALYKNEKEAGSTAAIFSKPTTAKDVLKVVIGNIPPNSQIEIEFSYIENLRVSLNKFWNFTLFSTFTPRYSPKFNPKKDEKTLASYPSISSEHSKAFTWTIMTTILSSTPIEALFCPNHEVIIQDLHKNSLKKTIILNPDKVYHPDQDFVLLFTNQATNKPNYLLTEFEYGYAAQVKFFPDQVALQTEDAYKAYLEHNNVDKLTKKIENGEYIFVLDRSGSMSGNRIQKAKEALIYFLKSLPEDSYFSE